MLPISSAQTGVLSYTMAIDLSELDELRRWKAALDEGLINQVGDNYNNYPPLLVWG